jgi:hypothetical protein
MTSTRQTRGQTSNIFPAGHIAIPEEALLKSRKTAELKIKVKLMPASRASLKPFQSVAKTSFG